MKLLVFSLRLRTEDEAPFAVKALPFLGGMLHGAWEDQIHLHAPDLKTILCLENNSAGSKRYAMLPPPYAQTVQQFEDGSAHLGFGVVLYGPAGDHAGELGMAFCRCPALRRGHLNDRIEHVEFQEHVPSSPDKFPALAGIELQWVTPLLLDNPGQRSAGADQLPPALLRVVRSAARRIRELEPELADRLGLQTSDWVATEESIRGLDGLSADWKKVTWRYGSRTKEAPVQFNGQLGRVSYRAPIPADIHALLQWGTWFGVGQRTALGQGFYRIEVNS